MSVYAPVNLFSTPFASGGDKAVIPSGPPSGSSGSSGSLGRANLADGFPIETQMPLMAGRIPPNRLDMNGILNVVRSLHKERGLYPWNQPYTEPEEE